MRIGLVLASTPGYSETFFRNKIEGLLENGIEVVLFVNAASGASVEPPCKTVVAPDFSFRSPLATIYSLVKQTCIAVFINPYKSYKLFVADKKCGRQWHHCLRNVIVNQFLLREQVDWLHFGFSTMALGRENIASVMNAKMAVSFRGYDLYVFPVKNPGCYELLFRRVDKVHVLSSSMKNSLNRLGLAGRVPVVRITPAIDTNFFYVSRLNKYEGTIVRMLTIARLHWIKGIDYVLISLVKLKKAGINFHYTIVGDGVEREKLLFMAHEMGISENVSFVGKLNQVQIKECLNVADIYIQYSNQEGFGNALLEAQSMGLLCIVSDADGLKENVLQGTTGWVVPKREPKLLTKTLLEVISLSAENQIIVRNNAITRIKEEFNLEKQRREFVKFYEND